jgi:hypothetical protein
MGLDMFFIKVPHGENPDYEASRIKYFRKHSDLHGWLQEQWLKTQPEGTNPENFNCKYFLITQDVLDGMKSLCAKSRKKKYRGLFWGSSCKEDWDETKELCDVIQDCLDSVFTDVYYYGWW